MAKKRKKTGKNRKLKNKRAKQRPKTKRNNNAGISVPAGKIRLLTFFVTLVACLIFLLTDLLTDWVKETPPQTIWGMVISLAIIVGIRFREMFRGLNSFSYFFSRKSAIIDATMIGIVLVIFSIPALIGSGTIETISNWIAYIMPTLNQAISKTIAWILTFAIPSAISGVIGNFVYDILKKAYFSKDQNKS